jgi:hypothetical protein
LYNLTNILLNFIGLNNNLGQNFRWHKVRYFL